MRLVVEREHAVDEGDAATAGELTAVAHNDLRQAVPERGGAELVDGDGLERVDQGLEVHLDEELRIAAGVVTDRQLRPIHLDRHLEPGGPVNSPSPAGKVVVLERLDRPTLG